jgi:CO/xanthine dehydrogenase FAD-binding subunit
MRGFVPEYEMRTPSSLSEALALLARAPGTWRPFAGGTDLMVVFEAGRLAHRQFINIWKLRELRGIELSDKHVRIGALATYTEIRRHPILSQEFSMLGQAAALTGAVAIQNRGTIGGNLANASPAADTPPALLAYDAIIEVVSSRGAREIPVTQFYKSYKVTGLEPDELIQAVRLPRVGGLKSFYRKVGTRKAQAISKVCIAATAVMGARSAQGALIDEARIAFGSVGPYPLRATATEAVLRGQSLDANLVAKARDALAREIRPIADVRSTAEYRLDVAANLLEEFLSGLG